MDGRDGGGGFVRAIQALAETYDNRENRMDVDPLDTAVHVMLSVQTTVERARRVFAELKSVWPTWREFLDAREVDVLDVLNPLGMARNRYRVVRRLVREVQCEREHGGSAFDAAEIDARNGLTAEALEALQSYPGIGPKVARCVALYSWRVPVLPLDTHGLRVVRRFAASELADRNSEAVHDWAESRLQGTDLHYAAHMGLMFLGRDVCRPDVPDCPRCPLRTLCETGLKMVGGYKG